jgi:hypothetical protein
MRLLPCTANGKGKVGFYTDRQLRRCFFKKKTAPGRIFQIPAGKRKNLAQSLAWMANMI